MKSYPIFLASVLFVALSFAASPGIASSSPVNDIKNQQNPENPSTLPDNHDADLDLASEIDDYRSRTPQGSFIDSTGSNSDLFGSGGYLHPFVSLAEAYSDNIFSENSAEKDDFSTTLSAGFWLAYPPSRDQLLSLNSSNTTPGGLSTGTGQTASFNRYQTYFLYQGDLVAYHEYSEANNNKHRLEGLFQYNLKSGISCAFVEEYKKSQDPYATGFSTNIDEYQTNLFDTTVSYDLSKALTGKIGYSYYWVDYDDVVNIGRNRVDNKLSASLEFLALPKTTFITEFKYIDIDYDKKIVSDSAMNYLTGGIIWKMTPKTSLDMKASYIHKNFNNGTLEDVNDFGLQISGSTKFNEKSSMILSANRQISETNTPGVNYILSQNVTFAYLQGITQAFSANLSLSYANDQYNGLTTVGTLTQERDDDIYTVSPGIEYIPNDWLLIGLSYSYDKRSSNFSLNDYTNNSLLLRATLSI